MKQLGKRLVPFKIPDCNRFGEHAVVSEFERFVRSNPFALIAMAMVTRDEYEKFEAFWIFVGDALHLFYAQTARSLRRILQKGPHLGGIFLA